jgi:trehalose 6-phosphate synthase
VDPAALVLASNRGPVSFRRTAEGGVTTSRGAGGLVSAMTGLSAENTVWVCAALDDVDREAAAAAPGGRLDRAGYDAPGVVMLPIDAEVLSAAYNAIANSTLWYLHHGLAMGAGHFDAAWQRDWASYTAYNRAFAESVAAVAAPDARVLVQDYHLALVPAMARELRPDLRIGHFSHTPWATRGELALLPPAAARELLVGMLGADTLGFHSPRWARSFAECCGAVLGAEDLGDAVAYGGRTTAVRVYPLGVDAAPLLARASEPDVAARRDALRTSLGGRSAVVRVDRTEPSKNIARGIEALRELLVRHPQHRDRVVHLAIAYPSRQDVAEYRRYTERVQSLAADVNRELGTESWTPVELQIRDDYAASLATLEVGDVVLVNPVRDGMNLVAKEAAVLTENAVLVLSREAGAADEMADSALLVDPFDVTATADALHEALMMPPDERAHRHDGLVRAATALPPRAWLAAQLDDLA